MIFTNKHVVIAMIVAPLLAILAWFGVGQIGAEKAEVAQAGQSYPLVEKSNCRYASGACDLENADFKLRMSLEEETVGMHLLLTSSHSLQGVLFAVGLEGSESAPTMMRSSDGEGLEWRLVLGRIPGPEERIKIIARAGGSSYFAEASTLFFTPPDSYQ